LQSGYLPRQLRRTQSFVRQRVLGSSIQGWGIDAFLPYILAVVVGLASGLAAIFFRELIAAFDTVFFGWIGGAIGEAGTWPSIFIPALGGLLVGPLIFFLAREAKGHGVPEVMLAVEKDGGRIRPRVAAVKSLASAITIGSGGSVGREGPIVQIASATASTIGQLFRLPDDGVRLLVAAGAAAGISATFNAPIAGVFFALEIILRHFNVRNFALIVVSSVVAAAVGHAYFGDNPAFTVPAYELESAVEFPLYLLLGIAAAFAAVGFVRTLYWTEDRFDSLSVPEWSKAAMGGLCMGAMGLWYVELLGTGYGSGPGQFAIPSALVGEVALGSLALLAVLKIAATSVTVGSGGSGGVFAPSLFIGAMLGGAFGEVANMLFPGAVAPSGAYATVGMAAVFAGGARAPMTAILILFELTRDYSIILPLMTAVVTATLLSRALMSESIYSLKLRRRGILLPESRHGPVLAGVPVAAAMQSAPSLISARAPALDLLEMLSGNGNPRSAALVVDVTTTDVQRLFEDGRDINELTALDVATHNPVTVFPHQTLDEAVHLMSQQSLRQLPVVSRADPTHPIGLVTRSDVFSAYAQHAQSGPNGSAARSGFSGIEAYGPSVLSLPVHAGSDIAGKAVQDVALPEDCLITSVIRRGEALIPRGRTTLQPDDWIVIIAAAKREREVIQALSGSDNDADASQLSTEDES
jgi:CIC family chloride channel protein